MSFKKYTCLSLILILIIFLSCLKIEEQHKTQKKHDEIINKGQLNTKDIKISDLVIKYGNQDIVGILSIGDNKMAIVQADNNKYYLNHALDKAYNILGTPFLDYRTSINDKKIIIYGHNSEKYNTEFKILERYNNKDFYEENKEITLETENEKFAYKIFSVAHFKNDYAYYEVNVLNFQQHLEYLKKNSLYETGINVSEEDDIILLQTCSNEKEKTFIVISGVKIKN